METLQQREEMAQLKRRFVQLSSELGEAAAAIEREEAARLAAERRLQAAVLQLQSSQLRLEQLRKQNEEFVQADVARRAQLRGCEMTLYQARDMIATLQDEKRMMQAELDHYRDET